MANYKKNIVGVAKPIKKTTPIKSSTPASKANYSGRTLKKTK